MLYRIEDLISAPLIILRQVSQGAAGTDAIKKKEFVCLRLYCMITHSLLYSSDDDFKVETWLSLYISLLSLSWRIYFWFVNLSAPWRRGHAHPNASTRYSSQRKAAGQLSYKEGLLYLPMACLLWGSHEGLLLPLTGSQPPAMLAIVPVCFSANPLAFASCWATSLRLSDLAVCREGFSRRCGNWFIPHPITHPLGLWLAWLAKEERRRWRKALWDEK